MSASLSKHMCMCFLNTRRHIRCKESMEGRQTLFAFEPWHLQEKNTCFSQQTYRQILKLLQICDGIIKEQEQQCFIERVDADTTESVHYLPHHPVKKDSPTTPIKMVYDCSCHGNSNCASLNDCLMVGPPILNDLCAILLHFCDHNFCLSTGIEKAFLHVKLHKSDWNFT